MPGSPYHVEEFSAEEAARLLPHTGSLNGPVFALTALPEVTRAALFARYSRSAKSLRRLLLDEFLAGSGTQGRQGMPEVGAEHASSLFGRVLAEYGDDSVAQLAAVHIACEQVSQPLAKAIEWGRLAAYLEQSTRYIPYNDRRDGHYRYHRDPEVMASDLAETYTAAMDGLFDTYAGLLDPLRAHLDTVLPSEGDARARARAIRALALDLLRGLLPAGTVSNLGVVASPQALEQMVLRLRAHPLPEARAYAELIAAELRRVIPDFVPRLDRADRGGVWVDYLRDTEAALAEAVVELRLPPPGAAIEGVRLLEWDADAEDRVLAAALYPHTEAPQEAVLAAVRALSVSGREALFERAVGARRNRRHKPGRGFEHTAYTFEVVSDYGAFRDLQRHRMLTIQWQPLSIRLGCAVPDEVEAAGLGDPWRDAAADAESAYARLQGRFPEQAQYLVTLGHRVRYLIRLNARSAMHTIELRTSPQGHPAYRRVCQEMHRQIDQVAGHHLLARAMRFVGSEDVHLPRYAAESARVGAVD